MRSKGSVNTERWETAAASDRVNNFLAIEKNYVCSSDWTSYFLFIKKKKKNARSSDCWRLPTFEKITNGFSVSVSQYV